MARQQEIQSRFDRITEAIERSRSLEASDDLAGAEQGVKEALGQYPKEPSLVARQQEIQSRFDGITEAIERSRSVEASGDLAGAEQAVKEALAQYPKEPSLVARQQELQRALDTRSRAEAIERSRRLEASGDLAGAEQAVNTLLSQYPKEPSLVARQQELRQFLETQRRVKAIAEAIERSRKFEASGDLPGAEQAVNNALSQYPKEPSLLARQQQIQAALADRLTKARDAALRTLAASESATQTANANRLREMKKQIGRMAQEYASDSEIQARTARSLEAIDARLAELARPKPKPAQPWPPAPDTEPPPQAAPAPAVARPTQPAVLTIAGPPTRKSLLVGGAAAATILAIILIGGRTMRPGSTGATITVSSPLIGAEVTIGSSKCLTPGCSLTLRPGTYALSARKDGYKPISQSVTIAPGRKQIQLDLPFEPLPQLLQVNTNFDSGSVYLDGRLAGQLQDGRFTASGIAPGTHALRVTGGGAEFETRWKSATGEPPLVLGTLTAKDVAATVGCKRRRRRLARMQL